MDYTPPDNDDGVLPITSNETENYNIVENNNNKLKTINIMAAATKPTPPASISSITSIDAGGAYKYFKGNAAILVGNLVPGDITYADGETSLDYVTWKTVGEVLADSTTYSGEDASSEDVKNEQGAPVYGNVTAGTIAFDLTLLSTESRILEAFLKAEVISKTGKLGIIEGDWDFTGFGTDIPNTTQFFAIVSGDMKSMLIIPKAEITASLLGNPGSTGALQLKLTAKAVTHDYKVPGTKNHMCYIATLKTA